jgi:hypothetical protein
LITLQSILVEVRAAEPPKNSEKSQRKPKKPYTAYKIRGVQNHPDFLLLWPGASLAHSPTKMLLIAVVMFSAIADITQKTGHFWPVLL